MINRLLTSYVASGIAAYIEVTRLTHTHTKKCCLIIYIKLRLSVIVFEEIERYVEFKTFSRVIEGRKNLLCSP